MVALALLASAPTLAQTGPAGMRPTPAAAQIFESDWVLMNWALKYYDTNHDIMLEPAEAQAAAEAFRRIADTDHDSRVTPAEYRAARAFILAHY